MAMTQMFRTCSSVFYSVMSHLARFTLRLPSLEQVQAVLVEMRAEQIARPLLLDEALPRYVCGTMRHRDMRSCDEDWDKPGTTAQQRLAEAIREATSWDWPFLDGAGRDGDGITRLLLPSSPEYGWSLDFSSHFASELLYQGVLLRSTEVHKHGLRYPVQVLVLCCPKRRSVLDLRAVHVSRQARRRAGRYVVTMDAAFEEVLLGCVRMHGEAWLFRGLRSLLRSMFGRTLPCSGAGRGVSLHSFELWDADGQLVAGELGCAVGGVYRSITGFRQQHSQGAGEVQLVLAAALLHKLGFDWIDLGVDEPYKTHLGSRVVSQAEYLRLLRGDRDKRPSLGHPRIGGAELLCHLQGALLDGPGG
mmetsp:Transcript_93451/g.296489  ORF Transcript_93451/g.296489 Transcript_93451/m.296489 type:complete len:361 (+) Transcript_93451:1053-2135(+)